MDTQNVIQGTDGWKKLRLGKATASKMHDLTARTKTGWGASRANYAAQLIAERLTGNSAESYTNAAMQWGTEKEPEARAAYSFFTDAEVSEVGFIDHPRVGMSGASPDGMVGSDGLLEIKCPGTATHLDTLLGAEIDGKYVKQMQWQLACAGRAWCDFVSFDPRLPTELQIKIIRVQRDDSLITSLERDVAEFLAEIDAKMNKLTQLMAA
jgi:putative phage-type endonuclease